MHQCGECLTEQDKGKIEGDGPSGGVDGYCEPECCVFAFRLGFTFRQRFLVAPDGIVARMLDQEDEGDAQDEGGGEEHVMEATMTLVICSPLNLARHA